MMDFRTIVDIKHGNYEINHCDGVLLFGSCFSDNIGERLERDMFNVIVNPFGTLYNPVSIANSILRLIFGKPFSDADLFEYNGVWHSFAHHSKFSRENKERALENINASFKNAAEALQKAKTLVITFGTAYIYKYLKTGIVVANCHKLPASEFERKRLSIDDIVLIWNSLIDRLWAMNPDLEIIFTVSPIRHLSDGAHGNQLSKSALLLAVDRLVSVYDKCHYFPSYEIVLDELRDYRFYASDMVHPSDLAVDYIMQRFGETYFSEETTRRALACEKLSRMLNHRPMSDNSRELERFKKTMAEYAGKIVKEMPYTGHIIDKYLFEKWNIQYLK